MHQIIAPTGDMHFGITSIFSGYHMKIATGWRIQFLDTPRNNGQGKKWIGKYVKFEDVRTKGRLFFKVLFAHRENGKLWLHQTTAETNGGLIQGFDSKYCKIISKLEYAIQVGL
jgi:hypothetical protein